MGDFKPLRSLYLQRQNTQQELYNTFELPLYLQLLHILIIIFFARVDHLRAPESKPKFPLDEQPKWTSPQSYFLHCEQLYYLAY